MKRRTNRPEPMTEAEAARLPKYSIGVVSKLVGLPPQMLRRYEEAGLLEPARQDGKNRLYSDQDITILEEIALLTDEGVNAAGIRHILQMRQQIYHLQQEVKAASPGREEISELSSADEQPDEDMGPTNKKA